jgi:hypothetical protein
MRFLRHKRRCLFEPPVETLNHASGLRSRLRSRQWQAAFQPELVEHQRLVEHAGERTLTNVYFLPGFMLSIELAAARDAKVENLG